MGLDMIKPYQIVDTRIEDDGETGVLYLVQRCTVVGDNRTEVKRMEGYMSVPVGADVDQFLFDELSKAGWF